RYDENHTELYSINGDLGDENKLHTSNSLANQISDELNSIKSVIEKKLFHKQQDAQKYDSPSDTTASNNDSGGSTKTSDTHENRDICTKSQIECLESNMQEVMDEYAGGISKNYSYNEDSLNEALCRIIALEKDANDITVSTMRDNLSLNELLDRLLISKAVIAHLSARKETRWHSFAEHEDYPEKSDEWCKYVNSIMKDGEIQIKYRDLVGRGETLNFGEKDAYKK
ncbi:MAG: hypothetical protein LBN22_10285, partial [Clostridiales Family XIII bacterium]|nr:hypothetical protein [Clostridiales Family XIII bacterium]